jgi:DNA modification methylase
VAIASVERAVRNSSKSRDIVLDPFAGSGSTVIACEKTGRSARLLELDPIYTDVVVKRWQEFTGKQAILETDGRTFAEVEGPGQFRLERTGAALAHFPRPRE